MPTLQRERRLILNHQSLLARVRTQVQTRVDSEWRGLGSWRDADVDRFLKRVVPVVETGQRQVSQLTNAHMDALARLAGMPAAPRVPAQFDVRNGVTTRDVYTRPFQHVWWRLSEGDDIERAVDVAATRLSSMTATDMQLAQSVTANLKIRDDKRVVGWQRVLGGGESCALCAIASTQRYSREDLQEIHDNCSCSVEAIYAGDETNFDQLMTERYDDVRAQMEEKGLVYQGNDFKSVRFDENNRLMYDAIKVRNHSEIGPVLTWADQSFTSAADLGI